MSTPTQITIYPENKIGSAYPTSDRKLAGVHGYQGFARTETQGTSNFFGEDGLGLDDVVDTLNPLQHIPFVSELYSQLTGDTASTGAKLIGGALLGGPIGFIASLANVIFEQETGHTAGGAVLAAIEGNDTTQVASAEENTADAAAPVQNVAQAEILPPLPQQVASVQAQEAPMKMASAITAGEMGSDQRSQDRALLSLYGAEAKSAHDSYRKAQFTPYLNDVTTSMVL